MHSAMRLSSLVSMRWGSDDSKNEGSVDVAGVAGVAAGGGIEAVAAGADVVARVSRTGIAVDL